MSDGAGREGTVHHLVLPWDGRLGLFRVAPPEVTLIACVPTEDEATGRLSEGGQHLLVIDQAGTRLRYLPLLPKGRLGAPTTLPQLDPGARIDDVAMVGPVVFAGGLDSDGARVWCYDLRLGASRWSQLTMPKLDTWKDKSVDFLLVHGDDLIGIDDFVVPLYGLVWDLRDLDQPQHVATVALPTHTTYERIRLAAMGTRYLALLSEGVNYGRRSTHLSICGAQDLRERAVYSATVGAPDPASQASLLALLARTTSMAFSGDHLFAATGEGALLSLDLHGPMLARSPTRSRGPGRFPTEAPHIELRAVPGLRQVFELASTEMEGVVAMGLDARGREGVVWVPQEPA